MIGCFERLPNSSPLEAELWGILKGITFLSRKIRIFFEIDSDCVHHGYKDGG